MKNLPKISSGVKKIFFIGSIFFILLAFQIFKADLALAQNPPEIYFFYSTTCPHCKAEKEFLSELKQKYPEVEIKEYEVIYNTENQKILKDFYEKYEVPLSERRGVPVTFTPTKYFIGFSKEIGQEIENCLKECIGQGQSSGPQKIKIPFLGEVEISKLSLPVLAVVFGALDGFNPCAMWILIFLIALLINTKSRARIWLVGGTFIFTSGLFYFLILAAWLNLFFAIGYVNYTRIFIGLFAIGFGILQLREFIYYQPGVCKVLGLKPKLQQRFTDKAEKIVASPVTFAMLGGVILLAIGVNLIEFFCSAGLPAIFTRVLALNNLNVLSYYFYLLLYTIVFMLDDMIIFALAIITLRKIGFTEKYARWSTLIGGLLIFILGILLIFRPHFLMFG